MWLVPAAIVALLAGGCGAAKKTGAGPTTTGGGPTVTSPVTTVAPPSTSTPAAGRPATLVAVTTAGALQTLDPATGTSRKTLVTGATGHEIGLTPDGAAVYYETPTGCDHQLNRIATTGGNPTVVSSGSDPTVSPDGTLLAFARQPLFDAASPACPASQATASSYMIVVRNLTSGTESTFPLPPAVVSNGLPLPISHLSWAPDGRRLAVTIDGGQDNEQWGVYIFDRTTAKYYATSSPLPVVGAPRSYYREAVFLPSGDLFVDRECCTGYPPNVTATALVVVDAASGATRQEVAIGLTNRDHASLDSDAGGRWLLYLSGADLLVSEGGAKPITLTTGYRAAAW
jgi:WD40-like Beta Propeller Repeat